MVCFNIFSRKKTVIHYYNRAASANGWEKIYLKNGKWKTKSTAEYEMPIKTIDIKNGYLEICDNGTGGGQFDYKIVLF